MKSANTITALILIIALLSSLLPVLAADVSNPQILAKDAEWKYLDSGEDLGTAWRSADFDDSALMFHQNKKMSRKDSDTYLKSVSQSRLCGWLTFLYSMCPSSALWQSQIVRKFSAHQCF